MKRMKQPEMLRYVTTEALKYIEKSAIQGLPPAQYKLAFLYYYGGNWRGKTCQGSGCDVNNVTCYYKIMCTG